MKKKSYIYNKVKGTVISSLLFSCSSFLLTACSDFFDILPMNDVVLENYWTKKDDVTSVLNGCYEAMEDADVITRIGVWGEMRSENIKAGSNVPNEINEILKENILQSNPMCNWAKFYNVINRCNVLCYYAPKVQAIDPNYTLAEMKANVAEATFLRSLSYFYLIRTFRDVPYTKKPSLEDGQNYVLAPTPFLAAIDSLIQDLEAVKGDAVRRYEVEKYSGSNYSLPEINTSRITCWAIYALLADLYLWKGDWDNVVKYCDLVLNYKRQQYQEILDHIGAIADMDLFNGIPLILERPTSSSSATYGNAYNLIFGMGNSFESLFELYYSSAQTLQNTWVNNYYYDSSRGSARLSPWSGLQENVATGNNTLFGQKDCRAYEAIYSGTSSDYIAKYAVYSVSFTTQSLKTLADAKISMTLRGGGYSNWIFYRLSDVILMKAEALIEKGTENFESAFNLINAVNKRALNATDALKGTLASDTLKMSTYTASKSNMVDLLFAERHREFLFEGKRWYDLVRLSRREGNTTRLASDATRKYLQDLNVIKIKLSDPNYIYFPYSKNELKVNPLLQQNPAFNKGEDSGLTK